MTQQEALEELIQKFQDAGFEQPQFEARQLVQEALDISLAQVMSVPDRKLEADQVRRLQLWGKDRARGIPLAYLSGHKGFYKHDFIVEPGVLVPRPETEIVVETALRRTEHHRNLQSIADLGCGSGCIGLSVLSEISSARLWSVDLSSKACDVTRRNAKKLAVDSRVRVEQVRVEDWSSSERFDIILANPPYIAETDERVEEAVRMHEPHEALFADENGFGLLRRWSIWAFRQLRPKGVFVCEFGLGQGGDLDILFHRLGFVDVQLESDLQGHQRVISGVRV